MEQKKLGFGFMRLPLLDKENQESVDVEQLNKMVDEFIENGFTYFDTAYMYHNFKSELFLKECLVKRHKRDTFTVASKLPTMFLKTQEDVDRIFNEQLEKCGVDYFDYYLIHNLGVTNYQTAQKFNAFEYVQKKKEEGIVKQFGFSFHDSAELLDKILTEHPEVDFVQLQINYLDWETESIQSEKCYQVAEKHGKPIIVMEPVKGGTLAKLPEEADKLLKEYNPNTSTASWAIRFAASLPKVMMVLSGMSDIHQLEDNMSYMRNFVPFVEEEYLLLDKIVGILNANIAVPCTACQYCVDGCPMHINIPKCFALYNSEKQALNKGFSIHQAYYDNYTKGEGNGKASDCIKCGKCEKSCPQHIKITEELEKVAAVFGK